MKQSSSSDQPDQPSVTVNVTVSPKKPSALDSLRKLSQKQAAPAEAELSSRVSDPAIAGAKPAKGSKTTVLLGFDPLFAEKAKHAAELKEALERATADFTLVQADCRDYGRDKRNAYNAAFRTSITTVSVPYITQVPGEQADGAVATETRYVQVSVTNRYSVQGEAVLQNKEAFGEHFDRLFSVEQTKSLKPNAEELIRGILGENGFEGEALDGAMASLFDTSTVVKAKAETFEAEEAKLSLELKGILSQTVKRAEPSLKFPG